jgi:hypothetical protein
MACFSLPSTTTLSETRLVAPLNERLALLVCTAGQDTAVAGQHLKHATGYQLVAEVVRMNAVTIHRPRRLAHRTPYIGEKDAQAMCQFSNGSVESQRHLAPAVNEKLWLIGPHPIREVAAQQHDQ